MPMSLSAMRTFQAVVRAGSITGGARVVGVSQATASASISALEDHLGTPLLQRTRSGVVPTEAGLLLFERCDDVFLALERIELQVRDLAEEAVGRFVLGCHDSLGSYFLPRFLKRFLEAHPRIELELWNRSSAEVRQAVIDREVDVGLVVNAVPHGDLVMRSAFRDSIQIFSTRAMELGEATGALREGTLVFPNRPPFTTLLETLQEGGLSFGRLLPCGDLGLAKTLAGSLGFGLLPRRVALDGAPGLTVLNRDLPRFDDEIFMIYRADLPKTRAFQLLRQALMDHAEQL
ncbi:MAG: LysR family transcriptional regulator [Alphaproteobacteria bacterium]|nr:LysR family transcriptional regulator [Alphaproteobacteria bacterium]